MNNQFGLGTGISVGFTGATVNDTINNIDNWQQETKKKYDEQKTVELENKGRTMFECAMRTTDGQVRKQNLSGANLSNMEVIIKQAAKEHGSSAYDDLGDGQILCKFMNDNPQYEKISNGALGGDVNLKTWARYIGADTSIPQRNTNSSLGTLKNVGIGAGLVGATAVGAGLGVVGASQAADRFGLYGSTFDMGTNESKSIQRDNANKKKLSMYEDEVRKQEKVLEDTKKGGDKTEIKKAEKTLKQYKNQVNELEKSLEKTTRKTVDTAAKYNLMGWSKADIGDKAKAKGEFMFENDILPALKSSKSTINVKELIDGIDIEELAKGDPDKLEAYKEALNELKKSFGDKKYSKLSMEDSQTLKSGLQGRTPQKFYKGQEITNEVQELKGILGSKIKNNLHETLTKEVGLDTAKAYLDYANLMDIARQGVQDRAATKSRAGFGSFTNFLKDKLWTPVSSTVGLGAKKIRDTTDELASKVWESGKNVISELKKAPVKSIFKGVKAILKDNPANVIMPDWDDVTKDTEYKVTLDFIDSRLNGKGPFKGKTEEEAEEMLPIQSIVDTFNDEEFREYLNSKGIDMSIYDELLTED